MKKEILPADQHMEKCGLCDASKPYGVHWYRLHVLPLYGIHVCGSCYDGNWDGFQTGNDARLLAACARNGLPEPARNAKGFLPRD